MLFFLLSGSLHAQETSRKNQRLFQQSLSYFNYQDYKNARKLSEKIFSNDSLFIDNLGLLAEIYHETESYEKEFNVLMRILEKDADRYSFLYHKLGDAAYNTGRYRESVGFYERFLNETEADTTQLRTIANKRDRSKYAAYLMDHPVADLPEPLWNSTDDKDLYFPNVTVDDSLLVMTARIKTLQQSLNEYQEDFYYSDKKNGKWLQAQPFKAFFNSGGNEGAQSISQDGQEIYFTVCNRKTNYGSCDLYYSKKEGDEWQEMERLPAPLNSRAWESTPSIASDGVSLYFSSNRAGGYGGMDLYLSVKNDTGDWSEPINLGSNVNTPGDEIAPFIHPDQKSLYFLSDTHWGLGKFDVFLCRKSDEGQKWSKAVNIGYPLNSRFEERGIAISGKADGIYIASDRSKKSMQIFYASLIDSIRPAMIKPFNGKVLDSRTEKAVAAKVMLSELDEEAFFTSVYSNSESGNFLISCPQGEYALHVMADGYLFYSENISLNDSIRLPEDPREIYLQPIEAGALLRLNNVFFETDSSSLKKESFPELDRLVHLLNSNPGIVIEIGGHTDSSGLEKYNRQLSEKRALSVFEYLRNAGIDPNRLQCAGYGSEIPVGDNMNAEGRALNRRTEIKIIQAP